MKTKTAWLASLFIYILMAFFLPGCSAQPANARQANQTDPSLPAANIEFTLKTGMADGRMVYIGVGGKIDGKTNPDLHVQPGDTVRLVLVNGDGMQHDLALPDFDASIAPIMSMGDSSEIIFSIGDSQTGAYPYFCTILGHRQAGMEGKLIVGE
jgi:nitrite reductase (NO-forming)